MDKNSIKKITYCRVCKGRSFSKVLTFGPTPLANAYLTKKQLDLPEQFFPLDIYFCNTCSLLQLGHVVSPFVLFTDYVYLSSTSQVFINHFQELAENAFKRFNLSSHSFIIDIGSNDGILLKPFKQLGANVLGIEPAQKIARIANMQRLETLPDFFSIDLAKKIVKQKGKAKLVTATNVFAHIDDLDEVIHGIKIVLADDGVFIMETPYLIDLLEKRYFDLVYHEHLSYWAIRPLITLFKRFDMTVFDAQKVPVHGGSIRVYVKKIKTVYPMKKSIKNFLRREQKLNLQDMKTYIEFGGKIQENKIKLLTLLAKLKLEGKKIAGYGAPAKGNTLLNFFGIGTETLDYIIDDSPWKQGLFTPGKRIPVVAPKTLYKKRVDYLLILAWNFAQSIMQNCIAFKQNGGHFIIPVPKPKII